MTQTPDEIRSRSAKLIISALKKIKYGHLEIHTPEGEILFFGDSGSDLKAIWKIKKNKVYKELVTKGSLGFAEMYAQNLWTCNNLPDFLNLMLLNRDHFETYFKGKFIFRALFFVKHLFNKNTTSKAKKNISFHYDLGNDFYKLWLDKTMTYSSATFTDQNENLEEAQKLKYQRIIDQLSGSKVLEIGCGWGGFAEQAADKGYKVKCITLSQEQADYANNRLKDQKNIDIEVIDYRAVNDKFDSIVSIEMFEAVGKEYWKTYFNKVSESLKSGGKAVIQTITIHQEIFDMYKSNSDFIQQYIFPGGMLPTKEIFRDLAKKEGLQIVDEYSFGQDYAKTLLLWKENFNKMVDKIAELGFDSRFVNIWNYYLSYCYAGFKTNRTDVVQFSLIKL